MAKMFPEDISNYNHTGSEKIVYDALKEQLPDTYHVYFSVSWERHEKVEIHGKLQDKTENSETDFLIVDPERGYLCLEVKGGTSITRDGKKWIVHSPSGDLERNHGPYEQARASSYYYKDEFKKRTTLEYQGVHAYAVCFPYYIFSGSDDELTQEQTRFLTLDKRDMNHLAQRVNEIFMNFNRKLPFQKQIKGKAAQLGNPTIQRFMKFINDRRAKEAATGALIEVKQRQFDKINWVQDSLLDFIENYPRALFSGGAGTGKTFIAMKKAARMCKQGKKVLYVCKSTELARMVARQMEQHRNRFTAISFEERDSIGDNLYDGILVDEAQDFAKNDVLEVTIHLQDPAKSSLYVFGDYAQDILQNGELNVFEIEPKPFLLKYNIRNTDEIYSSAVSETGLGKSTIPNMLKGVEPKIIPCSNRQKLIRELHLTLNDLIAENDVKPSAITVVSDEPFAGSMLDGSEQDFADYPLQPDVHVQIPEDGNGVAYRTIAEFKGLENDVVIYIRYHQEEDAEDLDLWQKNNYVAMTRARYYMYVINVDEKKSGKGNRR